ncbi:MAG: dicarboxylate/amino acid:cation symporter [Anaerolineaceae bacterium]|nr:dicarboxylate/amino acid:cation symporter [Anaerolineaceae bacterium]
MTMIISLSMVLGVAFGLITGRNFPLIEMLGQLFLRLIQMSIILLVTGQIIEAIGGIKPSETGKIGIKTVIIFTLSTFLAAIFGVLMASLFKPGVGVSLDYIQPGAEVTAVKANTIADTLLGFFPTNIMQSMSNGVIVQVIVFAIFFGLALSYLNQDGKSILYNTLVDFNKVIMRIIHMVMYFAPVGVFALVASSIGKFGIEVIIPLAKYLGVYGLGTLIFLLAWVAVVSIYTRISPVAIVKRVSRMSLVALATTSSAVTLPIEMEDAEHKLGVTKEVNKIVLPLGVSLNSNGAAMHMAITIITIAQLYGVIYGFSDLVYIVTLSAFASLANAVVPGAGLVSLSIVVPQMGLPLESIALFAGVEWFVGMLRTILNVLADTFTSMLVAKSENKLNHAVYEKNYQYTASN